MLRSACVVWMLLVLVAVSRTEVRAQGEESFNPSDPTNIAAQGIVSYEWNQLSQGLGRTSSVLVEVWAPMSERDLLSVEFRVTTSSVEGLENETGPGDTRLRYFHLIKVQEGGALVAWAPSLDLSFPTGDPLKGTGGGAWLIMPNVVLAYNLTDIWSAYPIVRYVHSVDNAFPALFETIDIPRFDNLENRDVRALNIEAAVGANVPPWSFTITPDFFHNFANAGGQSLALKLNAGFTTGKWFPNVQLDLPVSGGNSFDNRWKISFVCFI